MKATQFEFRFRLMISALLYFLGFFAPWERYTATTRVLPLWSWLAVQLARTHWLSTGAAYLAVTISAVLCLVVGALLRVWGTAYLGNPIVHSGSLHAREVVAAGPYCHVRNPLYAGSYLSAVGISVLMPASGALVFLVAMGIFILRLIGGEEAYLTQQLGETYAAYKQRVPRLVPSFLPRIAATAVSPQWLAAMLSEVFPLGIALCFAVFAWRYDADLLTRCVIIVFGASLVVRAMTRKDVAT